MKRQPPLILITPIKDDHYSELYLLLKDMRSRQEEDVNPELEKLGTIHYSRMVLLDRIDDKKTGEFIPDRFVFSTNHDGDADEHIGQLCTVCPGMIDRLYEHCVGYPAPELRTPEIRKQYLKQWSVKSTAFFVGAIGRTLKQIRMEHSLRNHIWNLLHKNNWKGQSASAIHRAVKDDVSNKPEFEWAKQPIKLPKIKWFAIIPVLIILLPLLLVLIVFILIWVLIIQFFFEKNDEPLGLTPSQIKEEHIRKLDVYEDYQHQNQFTQFLYMKPGNARLYTLLSFMGVARLLIKYLFVDGRLMHIPTIHFANWLMLDKQKTMLFFSNFDGSWQQYLGDFIDKSGWGLTGIWSNTAQFPRTKFLFFEGAYDQEHFLAWSRYFQIPTQIWYTAYPRLSIKNINNNTHIRHELFKNLNEKQALKFLQRF